MLIFYTCYINVMECWATLPDVTQCLNCVARLNTVLCGKRKRSLRDRSGGDCDVSMLEDGLYHVCA